MARYDDYQFPKQLSHCIATGKPFEEGDVVYTTLLPSNSPKGYLRQDYSIDGWAQQTDKAAFSYWKHTWSIKEQTPIEEEPSLLKNNKSLFIKLTDEDAPKTECVRFILALSLERNRKLKQIGTQNFPQGLVRLYKFKKEHRIYVVPDPNLPLSEIPRLQQEVTEMLEEFKKG